MFRIIGVFFILSSIISPAAWSDDKADLNALYLRISALSTYPDLQDNETHKLMTIAQEDSRAIAIAIKLVRDGSLAPKARSTVVFNAKEIAAESKHRHEAYPLFAALLAQKTTAEYQSKIVLGTVDKISVLPQPEIIEALEESFARELLHNQGEADYYFYEGIAMLVKGQKRFGSMLEVALLEVGEKNPSVLRNFIGESWSAPETQAILQETLLAIAKNAASSNHAGLLSASMQMLSLFEKPSGELIRFIQRIEEIHPDAKLRQDAKSALEIIKSKAPVVEIGLRCNPNRMYEIITGKKPGPNILDEEILN